VLGVLDNQRRQCPRWTFYLYAPAAIRRSRG
jgi:hypothetical protein